MTYSIFDNTGNLIDWFDDRAIALEYLAAIARAEPEVAGEIFLLAEGDGDDLLGEIVVGSSVLS